MVKNMNMISIDDIPLDIFFKYFNKEYVDATVNSPVLENVKSKLFKLEMSRVSSKEEEETGKTYEPLQINIPAYGITTDLINTLRPDWLIISASPNDPDIDEFLITGNSITSVDTDTDFVEYGSANVANVSKVTDEGEEDPSISLKANSFSAGLGRYTIETENGDIEIVDAINSDNVTEEEKTVYILPGVGGSDLYVEKKYAFYAIRESLDKIDPRNLRTFQRCSIIDGVDNSENKENNLAHFSHLQIDVEFIKAQEDNLYLIKMIDSTSVKEDEEGKIVTSTADENKTLLSKVMNNGNEVTDISDYYYAEKISDDEYNVFFVINQVGINSRKYKGKLFVLPEFKLQKSNSSGQLLWRSKSGLEIPFENEASLFQRWRKARNDCFLETNAGSSDLPHIFLPGTIGMVQDSTRSIESIAFRSFERYFLTTTFEVVNKGDKDYSDVLSQEPELTSIRYDNIIEKLEKKIVNTDSITETFTHLAYHDARPFNATESSFNALKKDKTPVRFSQTDLISAITGLLSESPESENENSEGSSSSYIEDLESIREELKGTTLAEINSNSYLISLRRNAGSNKKFFMKATLETPAFGIFNSFLSDVIDGSGIIDGYVTDDSVNDSVKERFRLFTGKVMNKQGELTLKFPKGEEGGFGLDVLLSGDRKKVKICINKSTYSTNGTISSFDGIIQRDTSAGGVYHLTVGSYEFIGSVSQDYVIFTVPYSIKVSPKYEEKVGHISARYGFYNPISSDAIGKAMALIIVGKDGTKADFDEVYSDIRARGTINIGILEEIRFGSGDPSVNTLKYKRTTPKTFLGADGDKFQWNTDGSEGTLVSYLRQVNNPSVVIRKTEKVTWDNAFNKDDKLTYIGAFIDGEYKATKTTPTLNETENNNKTKNIVENIYTTSLYSLDEKKSHSSEPGKVLSHFDLANKCKECFQFAFNRSRSLRGQKVDGNIYSNQERKARSEITNNFVAGNAIYAPTIGSGNTFFSSMRIIASGFYNILSSEKRGDVSPIEEISYNVLYKKACASKKEIQEVVYKQDKAALPEYDGSNALNVINEDSGFARLFDFKDYPINEMRYQDIKDNDTRLALFASATDSDRIRNDIKDIRSEAVNKEITKTTYKTELTNYLTSAIFDNTRINVILDSFTKFLYPKIIKADKVENPSELKVGYEYRKVYLPGDSTKELVGDILAPSKTEEWRLANA